MCTSSSGWRRAFGHSMGVVVEMKNGSLSYQASHGLLLLDARHERRGDVDVALLEADREVVVALEDGVNDEFGRRLLPAEERGVAPVGVVALDDDLLARVRGELVRAGADRVLVEFQLQKLVDIALRLREERLDDVFRHDADFHAGVEHGERVLLRRDEHDVKRGASDRSELDVGDVAPERRHQEALELLAEVERVLHVLRRDRLAVVPLGGGVDGDLDRVVLTSYDSAIRGTSLPPRGSYMSKVS